MGEIISIQIFRKIVEVIQTSMHWIMNSLYPSQQGGREGGRERGREGGREGGQEGGREGGRGGEREGGRKEWLHTMSTRRALKCCVASVFLRWSLSLPHILSWAERLICTSLSRSLRLAAMRS